MKCFFVFVVAHKLIHLFFTASDFFKFQIVDIIRKFPSIPNLNTAF